MNTTAYLTSQGWRGDGHPLHHSGRGITKPILVSKKANVLGIGTKKHDAHADQWWARAFDDTLKSLNNTKDKATGKTEGISLGAGAQALQMVRKGGAKWAGNRGLYSNFVRGENLCGTLKSEEDDKATSIGGLRTEATGLRQNEEWLQTRSKESRGKTKKRQRQQLGEAASTQYLDMATSEATAQDLSANNLEEKPNDSQDKIKRDTKEECRQRRRRKRRMKEALVDNGMRQFVPDVGEASLKSEGTKQRKREKRRSPPNVKSVVAQGVKNMDERPLPA